MVSFSRKSLVFLSIFAGLLVFNSAFSMDFFSKDLPKAKEKKCKTWIKRVKILRVYGSESSVGMRLKKKSLSSIGEKRLEMVKKVILKDPCKIFSENSISDSYLGCCYFHEKSYSGNRDVKKLEKLITEIALNAKYPELFRIRECSCWVLERKDEKDNKRTTWEDDLAGIASAEIQEDIVYAGFATGSLLPDLRILTRFLDNKKTIKAIHLIDPVYDEAIKMLKNYSSEYSSIFEFADKTYELIYKNLKEVKKKIYAAFDIVRFVNLISLLSQMAGKQIDLYIHKDVTSCLNACSKDKLPKANVAAAVDFHLFSYNSKTKQKEYPEDVRWDYYKLLEYGVSKNGFSGSLYIKNYDMVFGDMKNIDIQQRVSNLETELKIIRKELEKKEKKKPKNPMKSPKGENWTKKAKKYSQMQRIVERQPKENPKSFYNPYNQYNLYNQRNMKCNNGSYEYKRRRVPSNQQKNPSKQELRDIYKKLYDQNGLEKKEKKKTEKPKYFNFF